MKLKNTVVMLNSLADLGDDVLLKRCPFKKVDSSTYLGQLTTMSPNKEKKIKMRISFGWQSFGTAS